MEKSSLRDLCLLAISIGFLFFSLFVATNKPWGLAGEKNEREVVEMPVVMDSLENSPRLGNESEELTNQVKRLKKQVENLRAVIEEREERASRELQGKLQVNEKTLAESQRALEGLRKQKENMSKELEVLSQEKKANEVSAVGRIVKSLKPETEQEKKLRDTKAFFQLRELNRIKRAEEAGPRFTPVQILQAKENIAFKRLDEYELDPHSGSIVWPLILRESRYEPEKTKVQSRFRERLSLTGIHYQQFREVQDNLNSIHVRLNENIDEYRKDHYGNAVVFLKRLSREYEASL